MINHGVKGGSKFWDNPRCDCKYQEWPQSVLEDPHSSVHTHKTTNSAVQSSLPCWAFLIFQMGIQPKKNCFSHVFLDLTKVVWSNWPHRAQPSEAAQWVELEPTCWAPGAPTTGGNALANEFGPAMLGFFAFGRKPLETAEFEAWYPKMIGFQGQVLVLWIQRIGASLIWNHPHLEVAWFILSSQISIDWVED